MKHIPSSPVSDLVVTAGSGQVTLTLDTGRGMVRLHLDIPALDDLVRRLGQARVAAIVMKVTKSEVPSAPDHKP